jgi:hydrogenase maturation protease
MNVLVVAYGNPLRGDDGIAWRIADELQALALDSVNVFRVHQLTPELAETVSEAEVVIFLDAATDGIPGDLRCDPALPQPERTRFWHHVTPEELLALSRNLYAHTPHSYLVTVYGERFDHADALSDSVTNAIPRALALLRELVRKETETLRAMEAVSA